MNILRVDFDDLFEYNRNKILTLKRKTIINGQKYENGDLFIDDTFEFPDKPEKYFYKINPLRIGDTLVGWVTLK